MPRHEDANECYREPKQREGSVDVSLIIPAYNAVDTLRRTVEVAIDQLSSITDSYEVIVAEDGSTDGTAELAEELSRACESVVHLHSDERCGKGRALSKAMRVSRGRVIAFMDADLAAEPSQLKALIEGVREKGYDCSIGSRRLSESVVERPFKRWIATEVYNIMARVLLASKVHDHQCGFKAFKAEAAERLFSLQRRDDWSFDAEVLALAERLGYRIAEVPVRWAHVQETSKVRPLRDGIRSLRALWAIRRDLAAGRYGALKS